MMGWAGAAAAFAVALLTVPPFAAALHAGPVPPIAGLMTVSTAMVFPLWLEVAKRFVYR